MTGTDDDRAAIAAIIAAQGTAWAAGDAEAFSASVTDDVIFTNVIGMFSVGRAPFLAQHVHIFATFYRGTTLQIEIVHTAFVRPDVAIVDTLTEVSGVTAAPPGMPIESGGIRTRLEQVMVRNDGRWQVAAFHNVPLNERALAAAAAGGPPPR